MENRAKVLEEPSKGGVIGARGIRRVEECWTGERLCVICCVVESVGSLKFRNWN